MEHRRPLVACDIGERFIGVAVSNKEHTVAFPKYVWEWKGDLPFLKKECSQLFAAYHPDTVVVGMQEIAQSSVGAKKAYGEVVHLLEEMGIKVEPVEEYVSTIEAKNRMADIDMPFSGRYDDIAAQIILERFMQQ